MKIPESFMLMGHKIIVTFDEEISKDHHMGQAHYHTNVIKLATKNIRGEEYCQDQIECTFFHELTHLIFDKLNETKLADDERLVDNVGSLLHQFVKTVEYRNES